MFNPFSMIMSKLYIALAIAALSFGAVQTVRIEGFWFVKGYAAENARLTREIADIYDKQDAAAKAQDAADAGNVTVQDARNKEFDHAHQQLEVARRDAVADYVRDHRVRPEAACGDSGGAAPASVPADPGGAAGSVAAAELVTITPADLEQISAGAVRGAQCRAFLQSAIAVGLAVRVEP